MSAYHAKQDRCEDGRVPWQSATRTCPNVLLCLKRTTQNWVLSKLRFDGILPCECVHGVVVCRCRGDLLLTARDF